MVGIGETARDTSVRRRAPVANLWHGILPAVILMAGFFVVPIGYTIGLSFTGADHGGLTLSNYVTFFANDRFTDALIRSILLASAAVVLASVIAYPLAWFLTYAAHPRRRFLLLFLLIAPFWTSFTIRAFSWQLVLSDSGVIAFALAKILGQPVALGFLYTMSASVFGLALFGIMLITLTIFSVMVTIDPRLLEANRDLGGSEWRGFLEIVLPLSFPGWIIGAVLTFIICVGDYAVPTLLGGGFKPVLAQLMLSTLKGTYDLPMAATFAAVLMGVVLVSAMPLALVRRQVRLQE
ncbi:MAG: ABC transporter permease [Rhodobacteraceae bacterium]|nr:ABC transporter permease [Paracoccaceae bacterium]